MHTRFPQLNHTQLDCHGKRNIEKESRNEPEPWENCLAVGKRIPDVEVRDQCFEEAESIILLKQLSLQLVEKAAWIHGKRERKKSGSSYGENQPYGFGFRGREANVNAQERKNSYFLEP